MGEFLTLEEAAERLGVEYKTIYRLVRSGDLPAGKIGRIYRIRQEDLDAFFERQKRQLSEQARTGLPAALEGKACGTCGRVLVSRLSVAGVCEACGRPICQACWAIRKVRHCAEHALPSAPGEGPVATARATADSTARLALRPGPESLAETIRRLREAGRPVTTPIEAKAAEEGFVRAFAQRLEAIDELPDPLGKGRIILPLARVKHELKPTVAEAGTGPGNVVSRFRLRSGGWGRPKAGLVLEARFLCRRDRLVAQGYDADPLGEVELAPLLTSLREAAQKDACYYAVLIGSPTGWDETAVGLVTRPNAGRAFRDRRVGVALQDLHADVAHLDRSDERLREFWPLLAPALFAGELGRCVSAVAALLSKMDGVAADFAARALGLPLGWVRAAFTHLRQSGDYALDELPELGLVLTRKAR